ncbi:MAG: TIGR02444 family protein [Caulobacteraceae bacterium]
MSAWDFAVDLYGRPGVATVCLALQDDHGQCVPLLLWRLWAAAGGRPVAAGVLRGAVDLARGWDGEVVARLRSVRRALKSPPDGVGTQWRLGVRESVETAERAAERALLVALEGLTPPSAGALEDPASALREVATAWGGSVRDDLLFRLAAASG